MTSLQNTITPRRTLEETLELFPRLQQIEPDPADETSMMVYSHLRRAYSTAERSNDPDTHVGAALLCGFNQRPDPVLTYAHNQIIGADRDNDRLSRPSKYDYSSHAETRAIAEAASHGFRTEGGVLFAPWFSCMGCAKMIGDAGIKKVIGHWAPFAHTSDDWVDKIKQAHALLDDDYGIELFVHTGRIGMTVKMRGEILSV